MCPVWKARVYMASSFLKCPNKKGSKQRMWGYRFKSDIRKLKEDIWRAWDNSDHQVWLLWDGEQKHKSAYCSLYNHYHCLSCNHESLLREINHRLKRTQNNARYCYLFWRIHLRHAQCCITLISYARANLDGMYTTRHELSSGTDSPVRGLDAWLSVGPSRACECLGLGGMTVTQSRHFVLCN